MKIILIGPRVPPIGGTRVLFDALVEDLAKRPELEILVINTIPFRANLIRTPIFLLGMTLRLARNIPKFDMVSLHCGRTSLFYLLHIVNFVAGYFNKPWSVRTFGGGNFRVDLPKWQVKRVIKLLKRSDAYMAETKNLVELGKRDGIPNCKWYSNSRKLLELPAPKKKCRKFIYLGHIREEKGVMDIIRIAENLNRSDLVFDFYGSLRHDLGEEVLLNRENVKYKGQVKPDEVIEIMMKYDAFLLPSRMNEGYPGTIIEAYSAGIPVIVSSAGAISEIVNQTSGIVIEPGNRNALQKAVSTLVENDLKYQELAKGVMELRKTFDREFWLNEFLKISEEVVSKKH